MQDIKAEKYNLGHLQGGQFRELAEGINTQIFPGEKSMISVVTFEPNAIGVMHSHPEEQWGLVLEGSATRYQDDIEFSISRGDLFRTPPHSKHTMKAGPDGIRMLDVFAPLREEYLEPGKGFSSDD